MRNRTGWRYAAAGLFIACIAAVISYNDGLFVARLAGNHDRQAYLYPFLADGLIVVCLLALYEASRAGAPRSRWATGGIVLGIALTLAMNVYAGLAHTVLDAVLDGMVPVVFFIAVEVVLWHVRRGTDTVPAGVSVPGLRPLMAEFKIGQPYARIVQEAIVKYSPAGRAPAPAGDPGRDATPQPPRVPAGLNGNAHG